MMIRVVIDSDAYVTGKTNIMIVSKKWKGNVITKE